MFHSGQREPTCCCWLQERWPKSDFSFTQLCNPHLMIFWQCEQHNSIFIFQIKPRPHSHVLLNQMRVCNARLLWLHGNLKTVTHLLTWAASIFTSINTVCWAWRHVFTLAWLFTHIWLQVHSNDRLMWTTMPKKESDFSNKSKVCFFW